MCCEMCQHASLNNSFMLKQTSFLIPCFFALSPSPFREFFSLVPCQMFYCSHGSAWRLTWFIAKHNSSNWFHALSHFMNLNTESSFSFAGLQQCFTLWFRLSKYIKALLFCVFIYSGKISWAHVLFSQQRPASHHQHYVDSHLGASQYNHRH